jgi:ribosomal protein S18 acetylase RimI-like enzyme
MTTHNLIIRRGEQDDADVLARFNIAMAWETERTQLDPETVAQGVRAALADPKHGFYVVAVRDQEIVGSLLVTFEWSDWRNGLFWWIQSVYVAPTSRRQGVFKRLYEHVRVQAVSDPAVCGLRLYAEQANHNAHKTYTRLGMKKTGYEVFEHLL